MDLSKITCQQVFDEMQKHFDAEAAGDWNAVIQWKINGEGGGSWNAVIKDKTAVISAGEAEAPTATIETDSETWIGIAAGTINGQQAFFTGKLKIAGNMADIMKAQTVFKRPTPPADAAPAA